MGRTTFVLVLASIAGITAGVSSAALAGTKLGSGGSMVQGSAGPDGSHGEAPQLEHCDTAMGTIAVQEPQDYTQQVLSRFGLTSPSGLIRMMIQQSGCFRVVERGMAMQNIMQEKQLGAAGEFQSRSNVGRGQMVTADYVVTPDVAISEKNSGGLGAGLGFLPGAAGVLGGAIGGSLKFKSAQTTMLLADARTSEQVAAAQGAAKTTDFALGGLLGGGGVGGGLGAYENTSEGKMIAASFLDNWNNIVRATRGKLVATAPQAGNAFDSGDVVAGKIKGVRLFAKPSTAAKVVTTDFGEGIYMGEEEGGFLKVTAGAGEGWVQKMLVERK